MKMLGPWADDVPWIRQGSIWRYDIAWNPYGTNWLPPYFLEWEPWATWDASFHFGPIEIRRRRSDTAPNEQCPHYMNRLICPHCNSDNGSETP